MNSFYNRMNSRYFSAVNCGPTHVTQRSSGRWSIVYKDSFGTYKADRITYKTKERAEKAMHE